MVPLCANAAVQNGGANGERLSLLRRKIRNAPSSKRLSCLLHETLLGAGNRQLVGADDDCFDGYPELSIEDWHKKHGLWVK
jgi:hypothetical protein